MPSRAVGLCLALALGACGSSVARPSDGSTGSVTVARAVPCGPAGARTLAADGVARVFASGGAVRGCAAGSARSVLLGGAARTPGSPRLGRIVLRAATAAYVLTEMGVDTGSAAVVVRRLDSGRVLVQTPANTAPLRPESFVSVPGLVLAGSGAVAWISEARSVLGGGTSAVQAHAWAHGRVRMLDPGPGVDPRSLRVAGTRVRWRHGGAVRSASLG